MNNKNNKNKTEFAVIQLGYGCVGVAPTIRGVKSVAKKWTDEEAHDEINNLGQQFATRNNFDGDLVLLECSKKYANLVRKNGGDISYNIIEGIVYSDKEKN